MPTSTPVISKIIAQITIAGQNNNEFRLREESKAIHREERFLLLPSPAIVPLRLRYERLLYHGYFKFIHIRPIVQPVPSSPTANEEGRIFVRALQVPFRSMVLLSTYSSDGEDAAATSLSETNASNDCSVFFPSIVRPSGNVNARKGVVSSQQLSSTISAANSYVFVFGSDILF